MRRRRLDSADIRRMGVSLARKLEGFQPNGVVYIARGGKTVGEVVARELGLPVAPLHLSYPASRLMASVPRTVRYLLAPFKELAYRLTSPRAHGPPVELPFAGERIALIDDTASTGRTLRAGIAALQAAGAEISQMRVAVIRCGVRARSIVDFYELDEPVLFVVR